MTIKPKSMILIAVMALTLAVMSAFTYASLPKRINSAEDAAKFLNSLGWEVPEQPSDVKEVVIPAEFDAVYENYNNLQKRQGYDLNKYRSEKVARYTFRVLNHPSKQEVFANLLVFGGKIIGGDLCSYSVNGMMTGLTGS